LSGLALLSLPFLAKWSVKPAYRQAGSRDCLNPQGEFHGCCRGRINPAPTRTPERELPERKTALSTAFSRIMKKQILASNAWVYREGLWNKQTT